jgi:hypothetical protein
MAEKGGRMREMLYRGKRKDTGKWVYGNLEQSAIEPTYAGILCMYSNDVLDIGIIYEVYADTVGQYTGIIDEKTDLIFEGDIVRFAEDRHDDLRSFLGEVIFINAMFLVNFHDWHEPLEDFIFEVIGNIHDNPELLGEKI